MGSVSKTSVEPEDELLEQYAKIGAIVINTRSFIKRHQST